MCVCVSDALNPEAEASCVLLLCHFVNGAEERRGEVKRGEQSPPLLLFAASCLDAGQLCGETKRMR